IKKTIFGWVILLYPKLPPICVKIFAGEQSVAQVRFAKNPIKYYKRWALAYCLGYSPDEETMIYSGCIRSGKKVYIADLRHIDNMVRLGGDEALKEIKDYLDTYLYKSDFPRLKGKVNQCFDEIYERQVLQKKLEEITEKYHVNEDCIFFDKCN
ncbi:hypothetical protein ACQ33R_002027, partial [Campylobacter coli]